MEPFEKEDIIDLGRLARVMFDHKKQIGGIILGCTAIAVITSQVLPKEYSATTLVQTRESGKVNLSSGAAAALAMLGGGGGSSATNNYIELMKSHTVLDPIMEKYIEMDPDYKEPELQPGEERKRPNGKGLIKKNLDIKNVKGTSLIEVTGIGKTPEQALMISQSVVENFLAMQTDKNQQAQSLMVKFLGERIDEARKESEESAEKLARYSREHKIYNPDAQVQAALSEVNAYDKAIGEQDVAIKSAQAQLAATNSEIEKIKGASLNFNINDDVAVQDLRSQIVSKKVDLVVMEQKYTQENPQVKTLKNQVRELEQALAAEVQSTVAASSVLSLNASHGNLLSQQAQSITNQAVAEATKAALEDRRSKKEEELSGLPDEIVEYMHLKSDAEVKQEVYTALVQQSEQTKIQEAMDAMDIQIVDEATLPYIDEPSGPRKNFIRTIGFILGCVISFGYSLILYKREA